MALVRQNLSALGKLPQIRDHIVILLHQNALPAQIALHLFVQSLLLNEQHCLFLSQISVADSHGIALHIAASDVEKPHQIVQLRQKKAGRPFLLHLFHDLTALFLKTLSGDLLLQHGHCSRRKAGPILPNPFSQILLIGKPNPLTAQLPLVLLAAGRRNDPAVEAQQLALLHVFL